jgi:hypothetical protein
MVPTIQRFRVRLERPDGYSRGAGFRVPGCRGQATERRQRRIEAAVARAIMPSTPKSR